MNTITITLSADEVIKLISLLKPTAKRGRPVKAPFGYKKDGTPKKAAGRPRKGSK